MAGNRDEEFLLNLRTRIYGTEEFKDLQRELTQFTQEVKASDGVLNVNSNTLRDTRDELLNLARAYDRGSNEAAVLTRMAGQLQQQLNDVTRAERDAAKAAEQHARAQQEQQGIMGRIGSGARDAYAGVGMLRAGLIALVSSEIVQGLRNLVGQVKGLADEANRAETGVKVFERTVQRFGIPLDQANAAAERLADRFKVSVDSVKDDMTTLIRAGFRDMGQLERVMTGAGASMIAKTGELGNAFERLGDAAVTGLSQALNSIGVSENLGPALDKYAKSINKTADELTDLERAQVVANLVLKATQTEVEALDTILNDYTQTQGEAKNQVGELRKEIGAMLIPAVAAITQEFTESVKAARQWAKENKDTLVPAIKGVATAMVDAHGAGKVLLGFLADLGTAAGGVVTVLLGLASSVAGGLKGAFDGTITEIRNLFQLGLESLATFQAAWNKLKSGDLSGAWSLVQSQLQKNWEAAKAMPGNIWGSAQQGANYGKALMGEGINDIASFGSRTVNATTSANQSSTAVRENVNNAGAEISYQLMKSLAGQFKNNGNNLDSDCAFIAHTILNKVGFHIKGTAQQNAWVPTLVQNAIAAGFKNVTGDIDRNKPAGQITGLKAGDLLIWQDGKKYGAGSGMHAGVFAGYDANGRPTVLQNRGTRYDDKGRKYDSVTSIDPLFDPRHMTVYRGGRGSLPSGSPDPAPAKQATKSWQEYEKEARRIIGDIKKYAADGTAPNGDKWRLANEALKAFTKDNDLAAAAVAWVQSEIKKADKDVSKYGQTFDKLKAKLGVAGDLDRMGQNVVPQLKAIQSEAQKAADAEGKLYGTRNGGTEKYRQLLGLAADAAAKLNTIQNKKPDLTDEQRGQQRLNQERATNDMILKMRSKSEAQLQAIINAPVSKTNSYERIHVAEEEVKRRQEVWRKDAENRERLLAQRKKDGERDIKETIELAQRQGEAEKSILLKYAEERRRLLDRAQSGTLTAEDVDAYKARLASFVKEAGKAGVASSEVLKNAHASAMKFLDTAIDSNALAIANTASQYDGLSDAVSRGAARNAAYQASLEDVLQLLPGNADEWDAFIALMEQLDVKGNLAAGVMDGLRQKVQDLKDEMALEEGDRAAAIELANIAADPLAYADGAGRAGGSQAQAEARQRLADDLQQALLGLDDATLQSADAMQVYEDMLTNAAQQGAITDKQLKELLDTLNLLKGGMEDFSQYAGITDGGRGVTAAPGNDFEKQTARAAELANQLREEFAGLELGTDALVDKTALWNDILAGSVKTGAISETQLKALQKVIADLIKGKEDAAQASKDLAASIIATGEAAAQANEEGITDLVKGQKLLADAQRKVKEAAGEFIGPNADMIAGLEALRGEVGVNQEELERLIGKLRGLDVAAANQKGIDQLTNQLDQLAGNFQKAGQIAKMFTDGGENAVSILGDWVTMNTTAYKQFMSGDVAGAVLTTIEGILNVGESIASLNPQLREYKKNMLEIAALEKEAMGSKKYGNIKNPYYDELAQDAANREKLGNSKWYQRLWWNLTGSTPQVMEDGAAKLKAKAAEIFGDLADGINTLWNNAWEKAFTDGTTLDLTANLTKMLNLEVAKEAMAQVLEKANIGEYLKAYTDARAAGQDGAAQLEALRQALLKAGQDADAILKTLPGYGEGADPAEKARRQAEEIRAIEEQQNELAYTSGTRSRAEYEREKLRLTLERIRLEMEAALAAEGLTQKELARIRQRFGLQQQQAQAEFDKAERDRALKQAQDLQQLKLNNAETALGIEEKLALASIANEEQRYAVQEDFARRRLALTLNRIAAEEQAELARLQAEMAGEEVLAATRERYALARQGAEADLTAMITAHQLQAQQAAEQARERAAQQRQQAEQERESMLQSWQKSMSGAVSALLDGDSPLQALYDGVRSRITQGIQDGLVVKRLLGSLDPLFTQLDEAISKGMNPNGIIASIGAAMPSLAVEMQTTLGPVMAQLNASIPKLIDAVNGNTKAVQELQMVQTTVVQFRDVTAPSDRTPARLSRFL